MKKVHTCLVAAALTGAVLTVPAGAASLSISTHQGNAVQVVSVYQPGSCELALPNFSSLCPNVTLPGQIPELPGLPGGDISWPDQTPNLPDGDHTTPDTDASVSNYEADVIRLVNDARQENGLRPLTASNDLSRAAHLKSQDMLDQKYFSHTSPTYGTPFQMLTSLGIAYSTAGENIAYGQRTPQEVVNTWMNSPGHRANILNTAYTQIGVGYVSNGNYWTQIFIG